MSTNPVTDVPTDLAFDPEIVSFDQPLTREEMERAERSTAVYAADHWQSQDDSRLLPENFLFFSQKVALAIAQERAIKDELKRQEAVLWSTTKNRGLHTGQKMTEKMLDAIIDSNPALFKVRRNLREIELRRRALEGVLGAIEQKSTVLVTLGANARAELKTLKENG